MPHVMAALPNTGGVLCSTPQSLADAYYQSAVQLLLLSYASRAMWCQPLDSWLVGRTLPRRETSWNLLGCRKVPNWSQPLEGRSSPYCGDMWKRLLLLRKFFSQLPIYALVVKIQPDKVVRWCAEGNFLHHFCVLYFQWAACSTFQTCILNSH